MPVVLHPLFALSCIGDPLPEATAREMEIILQDNPILQAIMELPALERNLTVDSPAPESPAPAPALEEALVNKPSFGRMR